MIKTLDLCLLAILLSLGRLVLGQLVVKNDLNSFLARYENLSTYYDLLKVRHDESLQCWLRNPSVSNLISVTGSSGSPRWVPVHRCDHYHT